jgi:RNA recognition motif-containing protein
MKRTRFESEEGYQAAEREREAANELKATCELFVGNLPANANMDVLKTFFNAAMRQVT